jgi:hypothetical protein
MRLNAVESRTTTDVSPTRPWCHHVISEPVASNGHADHHAMRYGTSFKLLSLYPALPHGNRYIQGCVCPSAAGDAMEKGRTLVPAGNLTPAIQSAAGGYNR